MEFMCQELGVSRSGYYAWRGAPPSARARFDELLTALIVRICATGRGNPGVRRVRAGLAAAGHGVSHKRVHRLMQAADLRGRHPKAWKRTTIAGDKPVPAPDLIGRAFTAQAANTKWCGDISYIKTWDGWAYIATVIDLHSRALVGWAIDDHMRTSLVTDAVDMAISNRRPPAGVISTATAEHNIRPRSSTSTAGPTIFDAHWERPGSATTTPYRSHSSRRTRRN